MSGSWLCQFLYILSYYHNTIIILIRYISRAEILTWEIIKYSHMMPHTFHNARCQIITCGCYLINHTRSMRPQVLLPLPPIDHTPLTTTINSLHSELMHYWWLLCLTSKLDMLPLDMQHGAFDSLLPIVLWSSPLQIPNLTILQSSLARCGSRNFLMDTQITFFVNWVFERGIWGIDLHLAHHWYYRF